MSFRQFSKNTLIYATGNVTLRAASFLLIPLYTHTLSVSDYGLLSILLMTIQIYVILMSLGMPTSLVRFTNDYTKRGEIGKLVGTTTLLTFMGGIICICISVLFMLPLFRTILQIENVRIYVLLTSCGALMQCVSSHIMTYYRARNHAYKFMFTGVSAAAILFVLTFISIRLLKLGILGALAAFIASYGIVLLFLLVDVFLTTRMSISISLIPKLLKFGVPLLFSMSAQFVMGGSSVYFLGFFGNLEIVAIYSLGSKLAQVIGIILILPFQLAFQPFVFENINDPQIGEKISRMLTYLVLAIFIVSGFVILGSRLLLPVVAPAEYSFAYVVMLLLLPGFSFIGIYFFGETLLGASKKTPIIGLTMTAFAICSIGLNYLIIPRLMTYGAVIATNTSYILSGLVLLSIGIKELRISIEIRRIGILCFFTVLLFVTLFVFRNANLMAFCIIALTMLFGSISMIWVLGFFSKDEMIAFKKLIQRNR